MANSSALERWTLFVLRRRRLVLAAGVVAAVLLPAQLTNSFAVPDTESEQATRALVAGFGERPEGSFTVCSASPTPGTHCFELASSAGSRAPPMDCPAGASPSSAPEVASSTVSWPRR